MWSSPGARGWWAHSLPSSGVELELELDDKEAGSHALLLVGVVFGDSATWILELAPGLLLAGAGMGLCITPLLATVLSSVQPEHAGAASGTLSTVQQLGNALGLAVSGLLFFGALDRGYGYAFEITLAEFVALLLLVACLTRLLPGSARS